MTTKYTEVYSFNVTSEIKAGVEVSMLDKSNGTTKFVSALPFEQVIKALEDKGDRFYFWKTEWVAQKEPQATTSGEDEA